MQRLAAAFKPREMEDKWVVDAVDVDGICREKKEKMVIMRKSTSKEREGDLSVGVGVWS